MPSERHILTSREVAKYLHCGRTTIYRLIRRYNLPAFRVGTDWRFVKEDIDQWRLNQHAQTGPKKQKQ